MIMSRLFKAGITVLAVMVFGFTGCDSPTNAKPEESKEAFLTSLKVADTAVAVIPAPVKAADWQGNDDLSFLTEGQKGEIIIPAAAFREETTVVAKASSKASAEFASGRSLKQPGNDAFTDNAINLYDGGWLYIRVTAEDKATVNYYAVKTSTVSSIAILTSLQIADVSPNITAANYAATPEGIESLAKINLSGGKSANQEIKLTPSAAFSGTMEIAKVGKGGTPAFTAYNETDKYSFEDGDEIYVKLTSQDGTTVRYYGFTVLIGWDASVKTITFGDEEVDDYGTPGNSPDTAVDGYILMGKVQPPAGFSVNVTLNDAAAAVIIGKTDEAETAWKAPPQTISFEDGQYLTVKVVSSNGKAVNYYKISVELLDIMHIPYGTPSLTDPANAANTKYIDPVWDSLSWIDIKKQNRSETTQEFYDNPSSTGKAKLYWDEEGLWLYVDVVSQYMTTSGFSHDHLDSSVELFINEAYPEVDSGNYNNIGGQYRVGTNGDVSGDPPAAVTAFNALGRKNTFKTENGWAVILQAPWRFSSTYKLEDQKTISLEVQINAVGANGRRIGVLKWYNTTANTYQAAENLAPGVLELNGNTLKALPPGISSHPASQKLMKGETVNVLSVTAASVDGGGLSYQWYSNTTDSYTGIGVTEITGATGATYQPTVTEVGKYYYWVEVTNTVPAGSEKSANSNRAVINIRDPAQAAADFIKELSPYLINTSPITNRYQSVHVIDLGDDFNVDFYDRVSIDMRFYDKDNNEIQSGALSQATLKWWNSGKTAIASDTYNIGASNFPLDKASIPDAVRNSAVALRYLDIDSADKSQPSISDAERVVYIEIRSITFHIPE